MSNIFKRALSSSLSREDSAAVNSPKTPGAVSIAKNPSFSDFSMCAHDDAEEFSGQQAQSLSARSSLDERQPLSPRWTYILGTQPSEPRKIPQKAAPNQAAQTQELKTAKTLPRQPEGKIGGMSYHDYCDLIRSCSL
jgi:hypothetical protein